MTILIGLLGCPDAVSLQEMPVPLKVVAQVTCSTLRWHLYLTSSLLSHRSVRPASSTAILTNLCDLLATSITANGTSRPVCTSTRASSNGRVLTWSLLSRHALCCAGRAGTGFLHPIATNKLRKSGNNGHLKSARCPSGNITVSKICELKILNWL